MVDVLLFQSNDLESENKRNERINAFGETLNNAFKQFQKLWEDYTELLEKCNESKSSPSKIQNNANDTNAKCCTCLATAKEKIIPEEESVCIGKKTIVNCDPVATAINEPEKTSNEPQNTLCFQIFSQDFCTQGLEESFVNQSKEPLQEIQNLTPERAKSPVFGSKKGKTRIASSPIDSPNLSEKSVVILSDYGSQKSSKIEKSILDSDLTTSLMNTMSPVQASSPTPNISSTLTSKKVKKWGISTIHNVNTDIIVGTKKKLKQSRLFLRTEKVTDLSTCDEVNSHKSDNHRSRDGINANCTQTNNNFLEDSVIQGSPEQEKSFSKMGKKIPKKNKSTEKIKEGLNIDGNIVKDVNLVVDVHQNEKSDAGLMDTDVTIFDPRIASTQYSVLPCYSKSLMIEKSPVRDKPNLLKGIDPINEERGNDSNVIDETMFVENVIPSDSRSQKKLQLGRNKKLSLKKVSKANRHPEGISRDKQISLPQTDTSVDSPGYEESKIASPPRKKMALANFDAPPKKKNTSPTYAYKGSPVRKKAERALLNGWSCRECQKYYEAMGLSEEELQKRKNQCSRHRSKFFEKKASQKDYWDPDFANSYHSTMWSED